MFGDRFSSSTSCSRGVHETEPDRPDQSLTCCFLKVATHPSFLFFSPFSWFFHPDLFTCTCHAVNAVDVLPKVQLKVH